MDLKLKNKLSIGLKKFRDMRYGENPHQKSAYYLDGQTDPGYKQLSGIELSHNNLGDANHAWRLVLDLDEPTVAVIKHGNPSGIATRVKIEDAFKHAYEADSMSAFGGIIAVNRPPTLAMIEAMKGVFFELIIAPDFSREVLDALKLKSKKLRVVAADNPPKQFELTRVFNGYLIQTSDSIRESNKNWNTVVGKKPTKSEARDMEFAWKVVKHVRSNAIVLVRDQVMVGMGTGQPNRVNSVKLALAQAKKKAKGSVLASDAFFPFSDNVELAAKNGISVIIQPGGSVNDDKVIAAAKKNKIKMVFTGVRHFKH